ncbi:MAG: EF-hand domain-containing protein, partial [Novosphingobium sp.]|nr:EF-hand domain-containing protein [Novosphingobium sp.]
SLEVAIRENAQVFQRLDADRNGALTLEEFSKLVAVPPAPDVTSILDQPDRNRDQKVTIVEYRAATLANFDRLDTDLDGIVTDAEMKAGNVPVPPTPTR